MTSFSRKQWLLLGLTGLTAFSIVGVISYLWTGEATRLPTLAPGVMIASAGIARNLPDLRFQDVQGKVRSLNEFRGRTVLLNVWATWCVPCREEMLTLDRLQQRLGGQDFEVLALSIDSGGVSDVRRFYEEIGIRALAIYVDPTVRVTDKLRTVGVPTTLLIDRGGRELWRKTGPAQWDSADIVQLIHEQIEKGRTGG